MVQSGRAAVPAALPTPSTSQGPENAGAGLDSGLQPPVLDKELTLGWLAVERIVPVGFWSRVRVNNSVARVYGVKVKVREQQCGNEFDIEPRKSRAHANRPP
jgi:hypothetical protein